MKIAFLADKSAPFYVGGYEIRVFELAKQLARRHEVRVFTSLVNEHATVEGVEFKRIAPLVFQALPSGGRSLAHGALFAARLIRDRLNSFSPEVTIVEAIPYAHLLSMSWWAGRSKAKLILDVPEAWKEYEFVRLPVLGPIVQGALRLSLLRGIGWADQVVAISRATADSLRRNYGVPDSKISVVPLGLPKSILQARSPPDTQARTNQESFDFVTVARLVRNKRIGDLVRALAQLRNQFGWKGKAVIIGAGDQLDALRRQALQLGLAQHLGFTGFIPDSAKELLLRRSKAFVLPSEREGFSLSTLEAMGMGLPVVVAQPPHGEVYGQSEFLEPGVNGVVFPAGDVTGLTMRLHELLTNPEHSRTLAVSATATASRYTWESAAMQLEALFS